MTTKTHNQAYAGLPAPNFPNSFLMCINDDSSSNSVDLPSLPASKYKESDTTKSWKQYNIKTQYNVKVNKQVEAQ